MPTLSKLGSRPVQPTTLPAAPRSGSSSAQAAAAGAYAASAPALVGTAVPATDKVTLSTQAMAAQASQPTANASGAARQFATDVAHALFGAASLKPGESAHFVGTGQVVTADGQAFQFELEVRYEAGAHAGNDSTASPAPQLARPDTVSLTGKQLPAIKYPGSLEDLYKLLERELQVSVSNTPGGDIPDSGNLALRLQRLVNSAALLAPRAQDGATQAAPVDRSKALASSYGSAAAAL